jgi:hypothetical protein
VAGAALAMPMVALAILAIADDHGWGVEALGMMVLFVCIYAAIIGATWPTVAPVPEGWRPPRRVLSATVGIAVALIGLALYQGGNQ